MDEDNNYDGLIELVDVIREADPKGKIVKLSKEDLEIIEKAKKRKTKRQEETIKNESQNIDLLKKQETMKTEKAETSMDIKREKNIFKKIINFIKGIK